MRQFIQGDDAAFEALSQTLGGGCISFAEQDMPFGARPERARVGFERIEGDGVRLLVERGVECPRAQTHTRQWLECGERAFSSFNQMREWIRGDLITDYQMEPDGDATDPATERPISETPILERPILERPAAAQTQLTPAQLTDLSAVSFTRAEEIPPQAMEERLFDALQARIRGQDAVLSALSQRVARHLARTAPRRPLTFFALGPTGVGKTRTALSLSELLSSRMLAASSGPPSATATTLSSISSGYGFLRLDMSEYQERHRVSQLLGAPQGYVGYGDGAQLADALATNERTVVLFDEIEKAHPDIWRALMNAMDAGRLSRPAPGRGGSRDIDCRQAIFFFTSNLDNGVEAELRKREEEHQQSPLSGALSQQPMVPLPEDCPPGDKGGHWQHFVDEVCRRQMRAVGMVPELIGRISCFLAYRPLNERARAEILTLAITSIAAEYGLIIEYIEPSVISYLLRLSSGNEWGARPDEYLADEQLGAIFAAARQSCRVEQATHWKLSGPPFVCSVFPRSF